MNRNLEQESEMAPKNWYTKSQYAEEHSGASADQIRSEWGGMNRQDIEASVNDIWPDGQANAYLAECIDEVANG